MKHLTFTPETGDGGPLSWDNGSYDTTRPWPERNTELVNATTPRAGTVLLTAEPKRLRYRLLHVAGRIVTHARGIRLHLQRNWPWASVLLTAFQRLRALPAG